MWRVSTVFYDAFWSKNSKIICLTRTMWAVWIAVLLLHIRNILPYFWRPLPQIQGMTCMDKCVSKEQQLAEESIKASEGRGMTCFLWRCDLCWSLLAHLRKWWMYYRYECCSSWSNENNGKCSSCLWWSHVFLVFQTLFSSLSSVSCFYWMQYSEFHS